MEAACEKVAVYFEPDQSVITKITKDAKMTWSDKISWVGGENTIRILIFSRNQFVIKEKISSLLFIRDFNFYRLAATWVSSLASLSSAPSSCSIGSGSR